jgi:hypothetical protein
MSSLDRILPFLKPIEDLLLAHDGVDSVASELRVVAPGVIASGF